MEITVDTEFPLKKLATRLISLFHKTMTPTQETTRERLKEQVFGLGADDFDLPVHLLVNEEITGAQLLLFIEAECERREKQKVEEIKDKVEFLWQHRLAGLPEVFTDGVVISRNDVLDILKASVPNPNKS